MSTYLNSNLTNVSVTTSSDAKVGLTIGESWLQVATYYGCGIFSTIGNIAMAIGIKRSKDLRSRFFAILWFLIIIRAILASQFATSAIHRTLRTVNIAAVDIPKKYCYLLNFHYYHAMTIEMVLLTILVIDRGVAILAHNYYRHLTKRQVIIACSVACAVTFALKVVPSLIGYSFNEIVSCKNSYSPLMEKYVGYHANIDLVLLIIILILYIVLMLWLQYRLMPTLKAKTQNGNQSGLVALQRQMKLFRLLRRLVFLHCGLTLVAKVLFCISNASVSAEAIAPRLNAYAGIFQAIDLFANLVMLLTTNGDIRKATWSCFLWCCRWNDGKMERVHELKQSDPPATRRGLSNAGSMENRITLSYVAAPGAVEPIVLDRNNPYAVAM